MALILFRDEDEAVKVANDTEYGLAATSFSTDASRVHRVTRKLQAGIVWVNSWFMYSGMHPVCAAGGRRSCADRRRSRALQVRGTTR